MMQVAFSWPPPAGSSETPIWTGRGFRLGNALVPVLSYQLGASGWSQELQEFADGAAGTDHLIDLASRQHAVEQIRKHGRLDSAVILDAGCSSGSMLRTLRDHFPHVSLIGADYVRGSLERLASTLPDVPLLHFDLTRCPLPDASIDAVLLLNVLEHIPDHANALRQVHRILKPGAIAVIEVPAGPDLYDAYDELLMHQRRYSLPALRRLVESNQLRIVEQSHLGFFIYPAFWWVKSRNKRFLSKERLVQQQVVARNIRSTGNNRLLKAIMQFELFMGKWFSFPIGIRCLITARKDA